MYIYYDDFVGKDAFYFYLHKWRDRSITIKIKNKKMRKLIYTGDNYLSDFVKILAIMICRNKFK